MVQGRISQELQNSWSYEQWATTWKLPKVGTVRVPLYLYLIGVTLQSFYIDYRYTSCLCHQCLFEDTASSLQQDSAHREAIEIFKPCVSMHVFVDLDSASLSSKTDGVTIQQYQRLTNVECKAIVT